MIYLITPYSDPDPKIVEFRYGIACRIAGRLMAEGEIVFSMIAHTHPIASVCSLPKDWAYWERFCTEFITTAEKVVVVMLPGWESSVGVQAEIKIAEKLGKPITYLSHI
jgi:Domain of unknown function (DUF1937)